MHDRIATPRPDEARQVRHIRLIRVREYEFPHAKPAQQFSQYGPCAAQPHDSHARPPQQFLTRVAEQTALPIVHTDRCSFPFGHREQQLSSMTDDRRVAQRRAVATGKPQIPGHRRPCKNQRADWHASRYVEESRIATFVRRYVVPRERDRVGPAMVVNGEVRQPPVPRTENPALDKLRPQHAIAALPRHVVHTVLRQMDLPRDEPQAAVGLTRASKDYRTVLVAIPAKQMPLELSVQSPRNRQPPGLHVGLFIQRMTFSNFNAAVSDSGFSLFDWREIWIAG